MRSTHICDRATIGTRRMTRGSSTWLTRRGVLSEHPSSTANSSIWWPNSTSKTTHRHHRLLPLFSAKALPVFDRCSHYPAKFCKLCRTWRTEFTQEVKNRWVIHRCQHPNLTCVQSPWSDLAFGFIRESRSTPIDFPTRCLLRSRRG
jgi:hypothetical protein